MITVSSLGCLSSYSTKAALKAGQGTRLTKVSKFMEKTNNNVIQTSDLQVVVAELRSTLASVILTSVEETGRQRLYKSDVCLKRRLFFSRLFTQRTNSMRSGGCSSLLMPHAAVAGRRFKGQCTWGQFTLLCGDSCGRSPSRRQPLQTGTKGPRRSTRSAPLCGGRG